MKSLYGAIVSLSRLVYKWHGSRLVGVLFIAFFLNRYQGIAQSYRLGALAGLNFSNVVGPELSGNGSRIGIHLGGYAQFELDDKWGFRPEVLVFSEKGTSSGGYSASYFEIPLMATYSFDDKFMAMAGVQPSFLYRARVTDGRGDITSEIRTLDLGIIFAGWYQINDKWGVGVRIVPGISRVGKSGDERTYNANVQLSAGYRFM